MSVTQIHNPLPGEELIGIEPDLLETVDASTWWLHRLAMFTGRTLAAAALKSEQAYRAGRLAMLGQSVTHGVVKGLELTADFTASAPTIQVTPGYGICATGEDVALTRTLKTTLNKVQVVDPQTGLVISAFPTFIQTNTTNAGVLLLQPITGQVPGSAVDTGALPMIVSGNLEASCDQDPEEYAFEDWQIVDGVRLVMVAWPTTPAGPALPAASPATSWQNRIAYTIFNAEMALRPDDRLPWDLLGVPLSVIGFDTAWKPLFLDRSSVARAGGLSRSRYVLPIQAGAGAPQLVQPALAQARIDQFEDQLGVLEDLANFVPSFAFVPPSGVLPARAIDFNKKEVLWFPPNWIVNAGPVYQEELETALLGGMMAAPLDVTQNETVEILVPLPDALYDPNVLVHEDPNPAFAAAVADANKELAGALKHRKAIQLEANALSQVLTGSSPGPLYDIDAGLTSGEQTARDAEAYTPGAGETFGTVASGSGYASQDYQKLITDAGKTYTIFQDGNGNPLPTPLALFTDKELGDIAQNGLQHFINLTNARISKANDLIDLAFLTAQSDIYRFRQYIVGASDATALAVSPIAAEIATGESAASTAANLQNYLSSILPANSPKAPVTTTTPAPSGSGAAVSGTTFIARKLTTNVRLGSVASSPTTFRVASTTNLATFTRAGATAGTATTGATGATRTAATNLPAAATNLAAASSGVFTPVNPGTLAQPASTVDVVAQSPLVGAQLNLRTLTVAQRMANPPSQEGLFYAIGNRLAFLELLADLDIKIDDIPILVDVAPPPTPQPTTTPAGGAAAPTTTPPPGGYPMPTMADLKGVDDLRKKAVVAAIQSPTITTPPGADPDEASLFSTGIHVLEQHSQILRAVEGRIQQYADFVAECQTAFTNIETFLGQSQTLLTQLDGDLAQARQDVAFTTALQKDEDQRVVNVNNQRTTTLKGVQAVAYTRPRMLVTKADVRSRQLVPGNIQNPVPTCTQVTTAIPPELREIVALLREAPVSWMPSVQALLNKLERPSILQYVAIDAQARASMLLEMPAKTSSAASKSSVYAPVITSIYSADQQVFRTLQTERAAFQPVQLVNQSWTAQVQILQAVTAVADLISSDSVHAEVVNQTSRLIQQISGVATCLYTRAGQAEPIDRLAWAEFLRGAGVSLQLQSLAVLPNWNTSQNYVARQQMQMLVDWLFQQVDSGNASAVAFMSDVVRVSILLASDVPVDNVIAGAVTLATTPKVGGVITISLPSDRVSLGMYVQLFSGGELTAQAVVSDLDATSVRATVTQVYQPGLALKANDVAQFSAQPPVAAAMRAFKS
jgi:hypothetical protein